MVNASLVSVTRRNRIEQRFALPLTLFVLLTILVGLFPPRSRMLPEQATPLDEVQPVPRPAAPLPTTPAAPRYPLPAQLVGKAELASLRTANSATFDMGDGTYALLETMTPLHYQDAAEAWQPINPAFAATPQGWLNGANTIQTGLSWWSSVAKISAGTIGAGWQPAALLLTDAEGQTHTLATPLAEGDAAPGIRSADGHTVRYHKSWSDARLQDQWQSAPGSSEYTMRLASLPPLPIAAPQSGHRNPASLDLRVTMHLLPGTSLHVGGQSVTLPLETQEPLEFVGANGELLLLPPTVYEQSNPDTRVHGSYALATTADPTVIELRVRTPWQWLVAEERQWPVIIDPIFQVRSPIQAKTAIYDRSTGKFRGYADQGPGSPLALGPDKDGTRRILVRFSLPELPFISSSNRATITRALLGVVPTDINNNEPTLAAMALAYPLQSSAWRTEAGSAPEYDEQASLGEQVVVYSAGDKAGLGTDWDVTSLVRGWHDRSIDNHGILLRTKDERCRLKDWRCGRFLFSYPSTWELPDLERSESFAEIGGHFSTGTEGAGGVRLLVFYTGPTLHEGDHVTSSLPEDTNDTYFHADHEYQIAPLAANRWQAIAVRGLGPRFVIERPPREDPTGTYTETFGIPVQGGLSLDLRSGDDKRRLADAVPAKDGVSYVLLDGRTNPGTAYRARVSNGEGSAAERYAIQLVGEQERLTLPAGTQTIQRSFSFDAQDGLMLWRLDLPPNSNSRVDIRFVDGRANDPDSLSLAFPESYTYIRGFGGGLFHGGTGFLSSASSPDHELLRNFPVDDTNMDPGRNDILMTSGIFSAKEGGYALALSYSGPQLVDLVTPAVEFGGEWIARVAFSAVLRVTSCAEGSYPTPFGTCQRIECPTITTFPADSTNYREVGGLGLWSAAGWTNGVFPGEQETLDGEVAPLIGGPGRVAPRVAIVGGQIAYNPNEQSVYLTRATSSVMLVDCGAPANASNPPPTAFQVFEGALRRAARGGVPVLARDPDSTGVVVVDPWFSEDRAGGDISGENFEVRPIAGSAGSDTTILRRVTDSGTLNFAVAWSVDVSGWPSLTSSVAPRPGNPSPLVFAGLDLSLGTRFSLDTTAAQGKDPGRKFVALRATQGRLAQLPQLGGDSRAIQALILPRAMAVPSDPPLLCDDSCLDLRNPSDRPDRPNRTWEMPNVQTNANAGTLLLSREGELLAFSSDHPAASTQALEKKFSFKALKAKVSVDKGKCTQYDKKDSVIIVGEAGISIPNIGKDDATATISAGFKLCQIIKGNLDLPKNKDEIPRDLQELLDSLPETEGSATLRSVHLEFTSPVGIPVGSTPLFLTGLKGTVDIYPRRTTIKVGIHFQVAQGGDGGAVKGYGEVIIDTDGLFAFQGKAKILGKVDATGALWVAWNPLDIGFEMSLGYKDWLTGKARAHLWKGQGWQGRYQWLPDNDDVHIAAQIEATLQIKKGAVASWWFIDIPPSTISVGVELAFGEFCTNKDCTSYEWGIKGKIEIVGYNVGVYYGFDHGFDFILGNDDHVLIDQYNGAVSSPLRISGAGRALHVRAAPQQAGDTATVPITVSAQAESLLFGLGWQAGAPELSLVDPDGTVITPANATVHRAEFERSANSVLVGVKRPKSGVWRAMIGNLSSNRIEHYKFLYFANKGAPGTPDTSGRFLTPASRQEDGTSSYTITWEAPPGTPAQSTISLFSRTTVPITETTSRVQNLPIVRNLPFSTGRYVWDTSHLASGEYEIYAVVDDGINDFPADLISDPNDTCVATRTELPPARAFDPQRFPGTAIFTATGTIKINDTVPPAAPTGLSLLGGDSLILARWKSSPEADIAAYLVEWGEYAGAFRPVNSERVVATPDPRLRIVSLPPVKSATYGVRVAAIDASGNIGAFTGVSQIAASKIAGPSVIPLTPLNPRTITTTSDSAILNWEVDPSGALPASYQVVATRVGPGAETVEVTTTGTSATLASLQTGATYRVSVSASNSSGWLSTPTRPITLTVTNGVDGNNDGLPDDWANANGISGSGAGADVDGDGLTNAQEIAAGTHPMNQDSDGDGFSDAEELAAETDPLDSLSYGAELLQPRLDLETDRLVFRTKLQSGEPDPVQAIAWSNTGGGRLNLQARSDKPWLTVRVISDTLTISLITAMLEPGFHTGTVRLAPASDSDPLIGGTRCIHVEAWASPPDAGFVYRRWLPLITASNLPPPTPDLVGSLSLNPNRRTFTAGEPVQITAAITNKGMGAAGPFWVDFFINPKQPPTAANIIWSDVCGIEPCFGIAWFVEHGLAPGESITLTSTVADYSAGHTIWRGWFASGTTDLYLYVDSWNPGTPTGGVAESDETNNRAALRGLIVTGANPAITNSASTTNLPLRPAPGAK